jgi:hypothetical protein
MDYYFGCVVHDSEVDYEKFGC